MTIFLDSAVFSEVETAVRYGWVEGITTNPVILAKNENAAKDTLIKLSQIVQGPIFYQVTTTRVEDMVEEAKQAKEILGSQLILKIPATETGFEAATHLSRKMSICITAVYSPSQAMVAEAVGARYVAFYYNRAMKLMKNGMDLVEGLVDVLTGSKTELLAASLKSPEQVVTVRRKGVHHFTVPFDVLKAMTTHGISEDSVKEFNGSGKGLFNF